MTNKLKPFDLEAALRGEPVMLRDGRKAFIRHYEEELYVSGNGRLLGYGVWDTVSLFITWRKDGEHGQSDQYDIIGMYPKTHIINGFEVPAPETQALEDGTAYYIPILHAVNLYGTDVWYRDEKWHERYLKRDLVFLTKEDAIANAKAMLGIDPYKEGEE